MSSPVACSPAALGTVLTSKELHHMQELLLPREGPLLSVVMKEYSCAVTIFVRRCVRSLADTTTRRMQVFPFLWLW